MVTQMSPMLGISAGHIDVECPVLHHLSAVAVRVMNVSPDTLSAAPGGTYAITNAPSDGGSVAANCPRPMPATY